MNNHFLDWHERVSNQYLGLDKPMEDSPNPLVRATAKRLREDILQRISLILPTMAAQRIENETEFMTDDEIDGFPLAHAACFVNCPLALVSLSLAACPDQLRMVDPLLRRLPLHYAVSRGGYTAQYPVGVSCNMQIVGEISPAPLVLSKLPRAARIADARGQLPLHIAIDRVKRESKEEYCQHRKPVDIAGEINLLLDTYPDSLQRRDGVTKLYPFLQAAEGPMANLDVAYSLLRRDPSLIGSSL